SDIERSRPTLLIVDALPPGYVLHGFNYLEYFSQDARFRALLEAYRPLTTIEQYLVPKRREDGRSEPGGVVAGCRRMPAARVASQREKGWSSSATEMRG